MDKMNERDVTDQIGEMLNGIEEITGICTFEEEGVMTNNIGLVIRYNDGTQFQVTVIQVNGRKTEMAKSNDIFRTLKHYSHGYHIHASDEENKAYDAKVEELTERIKADIEHAPEIIAEEFARYEVNKYRAGFTEGRLPMIECNAEWKAIDNVMMALIDSKPLSK